MQLKDRKLAIFLENMYEDIEFWYPYYRMQEEGAEVEIIAPQKGEYKGKHGVKATADKAIDDVNFEEYDAVIIPGGFSPDYMRRSDAMVDFVRQMDNSKKVVAAICHGAWLPASADILKGKKLTSFHSIKKDLENAGAEWTNLPVVKSGNLITSRNPNDLPQFCTAIIEAVANNIP